MKKVEKHAQLLLAIWLLILTASCGYERSSVTGWNYNDEKNGGFEVVPYEEQETGPGLVLIEGGRFTMGRVEQDVLYEWDNMPRTATTSSFYMDETEITNIHYLEYIYWIGRVFGDTYPEVYRKALPDTLCWRSKLAFNEPYVDLYLRHPAYQDYPVVGVNWLQANDFCVWRTDRVNELILIREGLFEHLIDQVGEDHFNTETYLVGQYESGKRLDGLYDMGPKAEYRNVRTEDGILLPKYRLPTEAEWEFAALGLLGNTFDERILERKLYPWNGNFVRNPDESFMGAMLANFTRDKGDLMGVAGKLNDNADITAPVYSYWPNDYGLYNMSGNVSEWVMDVYRPLSMEDMDQFRPYRGNVFKTNVRAEEGMIADKLDYIEYDIAGIQKFLTSFNSQMKDKTTDEQTFIDEVIAKVEGASEELGKKKNEDAYLKIEDAKEFCMTSTLPIANEIFDGIARNIMNMPGHLKERKVTLEENVNRRNYRESNYINFKDGDFESQANSAYWQEAPTTENRTESDYMYNTTGVGNQNQPTSLIDDRARVYKGGSWADKAYWMVPGTRRMLDEGQSTSTIGFRCAMTRVGSPVGLGAR